MPLICLVIGAYDGFLGPGTGSFFIIFFYVFLGIHLVNASAVTKVLNFMSTFASFLVFAVAGKVIYAVGIPLAAANLLGGYIGSHLAIKKGQKIVRAFLLIAFGILFLTLVVKYFNFW